MNSMKKRQALQLEKGMCYLLDAIRGVLWNAPLKGEKMEKPIERMKCPQIHSCQMDGEPPSYTAYQDALAALSKLRAENEKLRGQAMEEAMGAAIATGKLALMEIELERVKAERDAAIEDLHKLCPGVVTNSEQLSLRQRLLLRAAGLKFDDACHVLARNTSRNR